MTTGAFNPSTSQLRLAKSTGGDRKPSTGYSDFRFLNYGLGGTYTLFDLLDIRGDGQAVPGLASTITLENLPIAVNWRPEDHAKLIAAIEGAVASVNVSGAAYKHTITPHAGTNAFAPLAIQAWRDDGIPSYFLGCRPQQAVYQIQKPGVLNGSVNLSAESYTRWGIAEQTAGTSTDPEVRGLARGSIKSLADGDLYLKVTDATPGVGYTFKIKVKVGAASTYDGAEISVLIATDVVLFDEGDDRVGTRDLHTIAYWANATGIALNDVWRIRREEDKWAQSLPTDYPLNETLATLTKNGASFAVESASVTRVRPLDIPANVGGRFLPGITEKGRRTCAWTFARKQIDVSIMRALEEGDSVAMRLDCYSGVPIVAGNEATEPRISLISMDCRLAGTLPGTDNPDRHTETVTLTAYPNDDGTYPDDLTIEVVNSQTTLA